MVSDVVRDLIDRASGLDNMTEVQELVAACCEDLSEQHGQPWLVDPVAFLIWLQENRSAEPWEAMPVRKGDAW